MRLGTWMARACPSMQKLEVPLSEGLSISLDLRKIDHQPIFLDGTVTAEEQERSLLSLLVPEGGTAIDVGAHLGIYTVTLARLVGPRGLVVAYEPCPDDLRVNTSTQPQVIVRPFAVCDVDRPVLFRKERSAALSRIVTANAPSPPDFSVAGVTLDAEIARLRLSNIDFLKLDVEGGEGQALSGAAKLLSGSSPPVILFEWVPGFHERWTRSALAALRDIAGNGWRLFRVGWGQSTREIIGFDEPLEAANIFGFPPCRTDALTRFLEHTKVDGD